MKQRRTWILRLCSLSLLHISLLNLEEESEDLASGVPAPALLDVDDTRRGGEDDVAELPRGQEVVGPLLHILEGDVVPGRDDSALVDAAVQVNDDLAGPVVIDLLELADVAVLLHALEEADDGLGGGPDQDLPLATLSGVGDGLEGVGEGGHAHHFGWFGVGKEIYEKICKFDL